MDCTVYLQCRLLEAIVISDKDLACSEVFFFFLIPVVVIVLSIPVIFLVWGVWKDRTDIQVQFFAIFQEMQCTE